ncbi:hypothetical protein PUN28_019913 [Cardiocondyla obscurior]|uniref:Uncharacterized protein n=1 Tax=Cardiocondyla obscurior TaxID=286306 RepID=A0AAW2EC63_9HYME
MLETNYGNSFLNPRSESATTVRLSTLQLTEQRRVIVDHWCCLLSSLQRDDIIGNIKNNFFNYFLSYKYLKTTCSLHSIGSFQDLYNILESNIHFEILFAKCLKPIIRMLPCLVPSWFLAKIKFSNIRNHSEIINAQLFQTFHIKLHSETIHVHHEKYNTIALRILGFVVRSFCRINTIVTLTNCCSVNFFSRFSRACRIRARRNCERAATMAICAGILVSSSPTINSTSQKRDMFSSFPKSSLLVVLAPLWPLKTNIDSRATVTGKLQHYMHLLPITISSTYHSIWRCHRSPRISITCYHIQLRRELILRYSNRSFLLLRFELECMSPGQALGGRHVVHFHAAADPMFHSTTAEVCACARGVRDRSRPQILTCDALPRRHLLAASKHTKNRNSQLEPLLLSRITVVGMSPNERRHTRK